MKTLAHLALAAFGLAWAAGASAAPCTTGTPFDEDGCEVGTPTGQTAKRTFKICEEKNNGETSCSEFALAEQTSRMPKYVTISLDNQSTCTAGTVTIIGRYASAGQDHTVIELEIGGTDSKVWNDWVHPFVDVTIAGLAGCTANTFDVVLRAYFATW